jgi:hypothetical protein
VSDPPLPFDLSEPAELKRPLVVEMPPPRVEIRHDERGPRAVVLPDPPDDEVAECRRRRIVAAREGTTEWGDLVKCSGCSDQFFVTEGMHAFHLAVCPGCGAVGAEPVDTSPHREPPEGPR